MRGRYRPGSSQQELTFERREKGSLRSEVVLGSILSEQVAGVLELTSAESERKPENCQHPSSPSKGKKTKDWTNRARVFRHPARAL
jgi:hypothetical protein